jgi:hypothetical protein
LKAVLIEDLIDIVVGTMVQLLLRGFFHVLGGQELSVLLVTSGKDWIRDGFDANDRRRTSVKGSSCHELVTNLSSLRAVKLNGRQLKFGSVGDSLRMSTETRVCES